MNNHSIWQISTTPVQYSRLEEDIEVDVLVIGAGITGMTAALTLLQAGKSVALIDAGQVGGVTTGLSTGNLYVPVQPLYQNIVSKYNLEIACEIAQSRLFAMDYIEKIVKDYQIECHFSRRPWYGYMQKNPEILENECETFKKMQVEVDYTHDLPFDLKGKKAMVIPNQARFNPLQYVVSMVSLLQKEGCRVYENTRVISLEEKEHCIARTEKATIHSKKVLMATHTPIGINSTHLFTAPYRSYVLGAYIKGENYPDVHLWKMDNPTFSICTQAMSQNKPEIVLVAGSHHKTGQDSDMNSHYRKIESFLEKHFELEKIAFHWSAQHYHAADNIPYIGLAHHGSKHIYMATGYFADGLIYGTLGGLMVSERILKEHSPWDKIYKAQRFAPVASMPFLAQENWNIMGEYLSDLPLFGKEKLDEIKPGEGKVVEIDQEKYAISRDDNNQLHKVSAVCTHMKCIVNWNNAEKTWDCLCHGSRFTCQGEVIEGPATQNLKKYDRDES